MSMKDKLNPKQRRFVVEYLKDQNAKQAAIRAGYSSRPAVAEVQGHRLLSNVNVRSEIEAKLQKIEDKIIVTKEWVLEGLKEVAERCLQRKPVMVFSREEKTMVQKVDEQGRDVWEFDSAGANKAFELVGRHLALFTDKVMVSDSLEKLLAGSNPPVTK